MPVSRRRTKRNRSEADRLRAAKRYHESRRLAATASHVRLSSRDGNALRASADAELRGDAAEAFRLYSTIDRFDDSHHRHRLRLLAELGTDAPAWLMSRWLTIQARRPLWTGAPKDSDPPALARAVEIAYPYGVATERMRGMSTPVFASCLTEFDWAMRQLVVYDDGRLDEGTAVAVARCPQQWTDIVADHARSLQLPHDFSLMDDGTDVLTAAGDVLACAPAWPEGRDRESALRSQAWGGLACAGRVVAGAGEVALSRLREALLVRRLTCTC